jgi:hypothetical protein
LALLDVTRNFGALSPLNSLRENNIGDEGAVAIAESLKHNRALTVLE